MMPRVRYSLGFTLIELLVTLSLLALIGSAALPLAQLNMKRQNESELRMALREVRSAIDQYKRASDEGRIARDIGATGYPPNLEILVDGVIDQRNPKRSKIFFLRRVPRDPFNPIANLSDASTWAKRSYGSEAIEPKEGNDVFDIYSQSNEIGLNGIPYKRW